MALVGFLNSKFRITDRLFGRISDNAEKSEKNAEGFAGYIESAAEAAQDGVKSIKEWGDELRDIQRKILVAKALQGLTGEAKEFGTIIAEALADIDRGTEIYRKQIDQNNVRKQQLEDEIRLLERANKQAELRDTIIRETVNSFGSLQDLEQELPNLTKNEIDLFNLLKSAQAFSTTSGQENPFFSQTLVESQLETTKKAILQAQNAIKDLTADTRVQEEAILGVAQARIALFDAENPKRLRGLQLSVDEAKAYSDTLKARTDLQRGASGDLLRAKARQDLLLKETQLRQKIRREGIATLISDIQLLQVGEQTVEKVKTIEDIRKELAFLQEENNRLTGVENEQLAAGNRELEKRKGLLSGSVTTSLQVGLEDVEFKPLGEQIANTITDAIEDVSGVVGGVFKDAIDPRKDADIKTAFGEFFLDLAGSFVEALTQELLISPLVEGLTAGFTQSASEGAAEEAGGGLIQEGLGLVVSAITSLGSAILGFFGFQQAKAVEESIQDSTQTTAATATATAASTTATLLGTANGLLTEIAVNTAVSAATGGLAKGGLVPKAFAHGGSVHGFARPSNIPASDTVPAWLTPGEFVMKRAAVQKWGAGLLASMNNGVINPASFSMASLGLRQASSAVQGFASGGPVRQAANTSNQPQQVVKQVVLPVLPASDDTMDQMISGGITSFTNGVNKVDYVGDPNRSTQWS